MMILGFYEIDGFINNTNNAVNPVGEISELGRTYSRNVSQYAGLKGVLNIFDLGTLTTGQQAVQNTATGAVAFLLDNIVTYNTSSGSVLADITAGLGNTVTNVTIGPNILNPVDNYLYPVWIKFTTQQQGLSWTYQVWLNNADFIENYPLGQFQFIYPVSSLLNLYTEYAASAAAVAALTPTSLTTLAAAQVTTAVTGYDSLTVKVVDVNDTTQHFLLPVLIAYNGGKTYCNALNEFSAFKTAVLASGNLTLQQWLAVIPSLVPLNKYYVNVNWNNPAIENLAVASPILSPTIPVTDSTTIATKYFSDYASGVVSEYLNYTVAVYKSAGLYILPDFNNLNGMISWQNLFPDYYLVNLSDINLQQMSPITQNVVALLDQLIRFAEVYTTSISLPAGYTVQTRGNYTYVISSVDTTQLAVLTRASAIANP